MAHVRFFLLLLVFVLGSGSIDQAFARYSPTQTYIAKSCQATRYPALCIQCLNRYPAKTPLQTPQQLAQAALSVSLYKAINTRAYMLQVIKDQKGKMNPRDYHAINDCVAQVSTGIAQLSRSVQELRRIESTGAAVEGDLFYFHISNVETWVSTAITDATNCLDYFPGQYHRMSKVKATIKMKVSNMAMVASNSLVLFTRYAAKYKAVGAINKP